MANDTPETPDSAPAGELLRRFSAVLKSSTEKQRAYNYGRFRLYASRRLAMGPRELARLELELWAFADDISERSS